MVERITSKQLIELLEFYKATRARSEQICQPLSDEDCLLQASEDVSPAKWHLGHTSWFFERFFLGRMDPESKPFHPAFDYIFNSYYETAGTFHARPRRGLLSRPSRSEVLSYRHHVDERVIETLESGRSAGNLEEASRILEIGLHHEMQHQELLVTDIKFNFFSQPFQPALLEGQLFADGHRKAASDLAWHEMGEGVYEIGKPALTQDSDLSFGFDNEHPAHKVYISPVALALRPATNREYLAFMEDGGYHKVHLWLSEAWQWLKKESITSPLYWRNDPKEGWQTFTLHGWLPLDPDEPLIHLSYYEADAFARWAGCRLPSEAEWEIFAKQRSLGSQRGFLRLDRLHPERLRQEEILGHAWQWTQSSYSPYPGYQPWEGSLGEYNGKFMVNQYVLRGGSCASPRQHIRSTYRNFFPASARWQFTGVRLAKDL